MTEAILQIRKEDARREVLRDLAIRHTLAHSVETILRRVNRQGYDFEAAEILAALDILIGLGLVTSIRERLGRSVYFKATAQGVLDHERA